jgi:starch-binding outer membrane protein, SusD/RagB family
MTTMLERLVRGAAAAVALCLLSVSCDVDTMLEVPDPDVAPPGIVEEQTALPAVLAGAIGDFMVAYNGTGDGQISMTALFTDELIWAETFPTRFEVDVRSIQVQNVTMEGVFRNLHRARISASRAAQAYETFAPTAVGRAEALNLEGLTYVFFGENYCNGVPFSTYDFEADAPVYGDPITNAAMFQQAVALFDSAMAVLGTSTAAAAVTQRNLARVGKARALLNLDQPAQAAAVVGGTTPVPTSFVYQISHSENTARQNNGLFSLVFEGRRFSVGQQEGGNGLPFRADSLDPRVPSGRGSGALAFGFDGATPMFTQRKHGTRTSPSPVATGAEARLIEAEADLRAGGTGTPNWLAILNTLRGTTSPALPALTDPGTQPAREDMLFKERAYWLWLTAHRLGDMRRLVRQYSRAPNTVFPTGNYFKGGLYGSDVNFPVPFDEQNNPNFVQCTDRNP